MSTVIQPAPIHPADRLPQPGDAQAATKPIALSPSPKTFISAEAAVLHYVALCPGAVKPEDLLEPSFWVHVAPRLKINAVITCLSDNGQFDIDLRVVENTGKMVSVRPIRWVVYTREDRAASKLREDDFEVRFIPNRGYGVRNRASSEWMIQDLATKEAAETWLKDHLATAGKN